MRPLLLLTLLLWAWPLVDASAQSLTELKEAYGKNSQELAEKCILKYKYVPEDSSDKVSAKMSRLVNAFVDAYCADTLSGFTPDAASKPFDEKYVVLQPRIRVCFVDRLDSAEIYGRHIPSNLPPQLYPHPGVYSSFLSANYYKFPEQVDCGEYNYSIQLSNKGRFTPLIADTDLVNTLNAFLKDTGVSDPYQKSAFLKKMLKLYRRGLVRDITGAGVVPLYYFNYAFFIDQVIFDKTMRHALIQFSFINQSRQAYYIRISNEWIRKVNRPCLQT